MFLEISLIFLCIKVIMILNKNEFKVDLSLQTPKIKCEKAELTVKLKYLFIHLFKNDK